MHITVHVPKADTSFDFDVESLPPSSLQYAIAYGLKQAIVDTTAGIKRSDFDSTEEFNLAALAKAQVRVDQILSGDVPGSRTPASKPKAEVKALVEAVETAGFKVADIDPVALVTFLQQQADMGRAA